MDPGGQKESGELRASFPGPHILVPGSLGDQVQANGCGHFLQLQSVHFLFHASYFLLPVTPLCLNSPDGLVTVVFNFLLALACLLQTLAKNLYEATTAFKSMQGPILSAALYS